MRIWLFHLLNDYSGSPLVLKNSISALKEDADLTICTSKDQGFLSGVDGVTYKYTNYTWSPNKLITLINFFKVQVTLFLLVLKYRKKIDLVYINTLLPFGAALGAKLCNKKVIYHMHEPQINPQSLFKFLRFIAKKTANKALFVSNYLKNCFPELSSRGVVLPNVLSEEFLSAVKSEKLEKSTILMLCSFKTYKGVHDFIDLAKMNPKYNFELVLNTTEDSIKSIKSVSVNIKNLNIHSATKDVHSFYSKAKVVLNLSHPEAWIESFGMTALEAMAYGTPCIVPEVGGIAEVITKSSGFHISHQSKEQISQVIQSLFENEQFYNDYSLAAKHRSEQYIFKNFKVNLQKSIL